MTKLTKAMVGTVAAGALAASTATPALARDHRDNGIGAGEIIAGALVIGGIAAIASAASKKNDRYDPRYGGDYRYDRNYRPNSRYDSRYNRGSYGDPRTAVQLCVSAAERNAARYTYGRADVTDIRDVDRKSDGYDVEGRIAVQSSRYRSNSRYGRGWGGDYRGYNDNLRGYDSGKFKCKVRYGRVVDLDYSGIRAL